MACIKYVEKNFRPAARWSEIEELLAEETA